MTPHGHARGAFLRVAAGDGELRLDRRASPRLATSETAQATSKAALDERPAPIGTSDATTASMPTGGRPRAAKLVHDGRHEPPPDRLDGLEVASVNGKLDRLAELERLHPNRRRRAGRDDALAIDCDRKHEPVVVVRVVADQVDAAGRPIPTRPFGACETLFDA